MILVNVTQIRIYPIDNFWTPTNECFNWCQIQQVTHSNNMEGYMLFFIAGAYLMILLYSSARDYKILEKFKDGFIDIAKYLIISFVFIVFLVFRYRIHW